MARDVRILGIDPGSRVTGYGIVDAEGNRLRYVASGTIRTVAPDLGERLAEIHAGVLSLIETHGPEEVAVEEVFLARNANSALKLGQARGAALAAVVSRRLSVNEYAARRVKLAVTGTGGATKAQVQHMVRVLLNLDGSPGSDAADALAIAICHINTRTPLIQDH